MSDIDALRRELADRPDDPALWTKLGNVLSAGGQHVQAIDAFAHAVTYRPDAASFVNLAGAMLFAGQRDEAIVACREALARSPDFVPALIDLGAALREAGKAGEALPILERAVALEPGSAGAHHNLGIVLADFGRLNEAREAFRRAIIINQEWAGPRYALGNVLRDLGELRDAVIQFRAAVRIDPGFGNAWSNLLFTLNFVPGETDESLARANRNWAATIEAAGEALPPPANDRNPRRQLRIGYLSNEFRRHHFLTDFLPVLKAHDRVRFHITCYADVAVPDSETVRVAGLADTFRNLHGLDLAAQAASIRADKIDILVSLTGYLANDRCLFARRIAPVQASYINHVTTTGLRNVDYRITDPWLDPPGSETPLDPETPVRLTTGYTVYSPPDNAPEPGAPPAMLRGYPTFGCFNTLIKVTDETLALWAELLRRMPNSRLVIKARELSQAAVLNSFRARMAAGGLDAARCELIGYVADQRAHLLHYTQVDIGLDPVPFAGGATTREMLWMGLPVVTLAGATRASRAGSTLLHRAGLGNLVAMTPDQYLRIAAELAADLPRLAALRAGQRGRLAASKLLDGVAHTRELEQAYRRLWEDWCAGGERPPGIGTGGIGR
jgi:predicted O-linked N-acetylglucosamine transferase (SPINDLY family)